MVSFVNLIQSKIVEESLHVGSSALGYRYAVEDYLELTDAGRLSSPCDVGWLVLKKRERSVYLVSSFPNSIQFSWVLPPNL